MSIFSRFFPKPKSRGGSSIVPLMVADMSGVAATAGGGSSSSVTSSGGSPSGGGGGSGGSCGSSASSCHNWSDRWDYPDHFNARIMLLDSHAGVVGVEGQTPWICVGIIPAIHPYKRVWIQKI
jgi:hypothetical protein